MTKQLYLFIGTREDIEGENIHLLMYEIEPKLQ